MVVKYLLAINIIATARKRYHSLTHPKGTSKA